MTAPLISAENDLSLDGPRPWGLFGKKPSFDILRGVSLELHRGETIGIVGESPVPARRRWAGVWCGCMNRPTA